MKNMKVDEGKWEIFELSNLRTLRRMLLRSIFAMREPVTAVYDGGGVYFGGGSSSVRDAAPLSSEMCSDVTSGIVAA